MDRLAWLNGLIMQEFSSIGKKGSTWPWLWLWLWLWPWRRLLLEEKEVSSAIAIAMVVVVVAVLTISFAAPLNSARSFSMILAESGALNSSAIAHSTNAVVASVL